jgi:hypothetical protein
VAAKEPLILNLENLEMKKSLIAMAALAAAGVASAQSTSTLSGVLDFGLEKSASGAALQASNSRNGTTQITWSGSEDLGGGLKANFKVSTSFDATFANNGATAAPTNQILGNNDMYVGMAGGFGEVRLGRSFNPVFEAGLTANGTKGVSGYATRGNTLDNVGVYVSNQVQYLSPRLGGVQLVVSWAPKEDTAAAKNHMGVRLNYSAGPLVANLAVANNTNGSGAVVGTKNWTHLSAAYDFGMARLLFSYQDDGNNTSATDSAYVVSATVPVGAHQFWAQYGVAEAATGSDARILSAGFKYNMSKRTLAYVSIGNRNNAAAGFNAAQTKGTGYGVGLQHNF